MHETKEMQSTKSTYKSERQKKNCTKWDESETDSVKEAQSGCRGKEQENEMQTLDNMRVRQINESPIKCDTQTNMKNAQHLSLSSAFLCSVCG